LAAPGGQPQQQPQPVAEDTTIRIVRVKLDDGLYVERVIPLLGVVTIQDDGHDFSLVDILRLESNRPYQVIYSKEPITIVAGQTRRLQLTARNWSPSDLTLQLDGSGPNGWSVTPVKGSVAVPALSDESFAMEVTASADARRGHYEVRAETRYAPGPDQNFVCVLALEVLDALAPHVDQVKDWPRPAADERSRIRGQGTFAVFAKAGEPITAKVTNIGVTRYEDTLSWRLMGPKMQVLEQGRIAVDKMSTISHTAPTSGTYYLEVVPKQGSADVEFTNRAVAEVATQAAPLMLYHSDITRYFLVPRHAREFQLGARDGGPTETGRFVISSPTGRIAFQSDGNYQGALFPIQVQPDEAGKLWSIRVEPRQDLSFWLTGDVLPYLSTAPQRVLDRGR